MDDDQHRALPAEQAPELVALRWELSTLHAQVARLEFANQLQRVLGPSLLLVLAAITPLLGRDDGRTYTFVEIVNSSSRRGTGWTTVVLILIGVGWAFCLLGGWLLASNDSARSTYLAVTVPAGALLLGLVVLVLTGAGWFSRGDSYSGLQIGTALAAAAAIWLMITSVSLATSTKRRARWASEVSP